MIKLLDHGYLRLVTFWGSDQEIVEAARMSTGKGFLGWGIVEDCANCEGYNCRTCGGYLSPHGPGKHINKPGDEKLLRFLYENAHHTPFEMAGATFEVKAPIFAFREWHRHRVPFSYNEMSARYTPLPDENYIPTVERLMLNARAAAASGNKQAGTIAGAEVLTESLAEQFRADLKYTYTKQQEVYENALKWGVPKELARVHLPVGRYSRMRASSNVRGWTNFMKLRCDRRAQWEIRQYANALHDELLKLFPRTIALFDEGMK